MPDLGATEIIIIAVVVVLLFGAKRLPDASRSIGRSLRIFRSEVRGMSEDEKAAKAKELPIAEASTPSTPTAPATPVEPAEPGETR